MLSVNDLSINFGGNVLFSRVDLQFTPGKIGRASCRERV